MPRPIRASISTAWMPPTSSPSWPASPSAPGSTWRPCMSRASAAFPRSISPSPRNWDTGSSCWASRGSRMPGWSSASIPAWCRWKPRSRMWTASSMPSWSRAAPSAARCSKARGPVRDRPPRRSPPTSSTSRAATGRLSSACRRRPSSPCRRRRWTPIAAPTTSASWWWTARACSHRWRRAWARTVFPSSRCCSGGARRRSGFPW